MAADIQGETDSVTKIYPRPPLSLIESGLGPHGFDIYIGGAEAARDVSLLREHGITIIVNCAVNLDINHVIEPNEPATGDKCAHGTGPFRIYKLGLVDGPGNTDYMMLAGLIMLDGAVRQVLPERDSYPRRERGNVLVNCRGGRSRSTALVALYLNFSKADKYPTLDAAIDHVRLMRELHPDEWHEAPKPVLIDAARRAAKAARDLGMIDRY